jgi:hypothetical protein
MTRDVREILSQLPDPLQIQITNSGITRTNLSLFDYDLITTNKPWPAGITVSTGLAGLSFQQLLLTLKNNPYKIGMIGFVPSNYRQSGIYINHYDIQGNGKYYSMVFTLDPYQRQQIIYTPANFILDDLTNLTIAVVPPGVTNVQLFPYSDKMKEVSFSDVGKTVTVTEGLNGKNMNARIAKGTPVEMPTIHGNNNPAPTVLGMPEYQAYRLLTGAVLASITVGVIYWIGKDMKNK